MPIIRTVINELKTIIDFTFGLSVIAIGLFSFFIDGRVFETKKLKKEARVAKIIGVVYIIAGPLLYIVIQFA